MIRLDGLPELYGSTSRLLLRPLSPADAAAYRRLYQCPRIMRFIGPVLSDRDAQASFAATLKLQDGQSKLPDWRLRIALSPIGASSLLGLLALESCPRPDAVELGVLLHPDVQGQGLALEALEALIRRLRKIGMTRAQLCADRHNEPMSGLARRLGFTADGQAAGSHAQVVHRCVYDGTRDHPTSGDHST